MRSQIFPPALCLIIAILFFVNPTFLTAKSLHSETIITNNVVFTFAQQTSPSNQNIKQHISNKNSKILTSEDAPASKLNTTIIHESSLIQEKLFDSATNVATGKTVYQLNGDSSLFKKGVFYGFAMMVILLNFICFFLFEEKIFLFFSLNLAALIAFLISIDSLFPLIGINSIENTEAIQTTMFFIATAFGALFASKYLTLEEFYPKLKWTAASLLVLSFVMVILSGISETSFYSSVANVINFSVLALYFLVGISLFSKKNYAKFYVVALGFPLLFLLDMLVFKKLGFDFLSAENSHLKEATVVEMLLMTLAIIYRMKAVKEESERKQTEMRIFLERQEVLNRTNAQELVQDIHLEDLIMKYDLDGLEIKILQYISEGKDNAKIAQKLKTTEREIESYTKELYNKLEIEDQIEEDHRMLRAQADYIYN